MRWKNSSNIFHVTLFTFVILTASCTSMPPGYSTLKEMCDKAEVKVDHKVYAKGYFNEYAKGCVNCQLDLIDIGYQFVEFENSEDWWRLGSPGKWRLYAAGKNDQHCLENATAKYGEYKYEPYQKFFESHCIAAKKISQLESRYSYNMSTEERYLDKNKNIKLVKIDSTVTDLETSEKLARDVDYLLFPYKKSALAYGYEIDCFKLNKNRPRIPFPAGIIIPIK